MSRTLSDRERTVLIVGGVVVAAILLYVGVFESYRGMLTRLDKSIATRTQQLAELEELRGEARALQQQIREAEGKLTESGGFSLVKFTEDLAARTAGRGALTYARPQPAATRGELQEESLETRIERLSLEQVLRLLWGIQNAPVPMRVRGLQLNKRFDAPAQLDLTLTISAMRKGS